MLRLIEDGWRLKRDLVSDGFDQALERIAQEIPLTAHRYPSGSEAWTWVIPDKWTCREAYLERMNGERLFSYADHPLHVASYSSAFEGVISRAELFKRLKTHRIPDAIPFDWKYYKSDWGLCCSQEQKDRLTDPEYRVVIRSEHVPGELKVGEAVAPGSSGQDFILAAHLCHPHQMNDDFSGVVVAVEVMRRLLEWPSRRYTYRLLFTPETIGSLAWLSRNEDKIPLIQGGLFLEMLGTDCPHSLQLSFAANTEMDLCLQEALKERDKGAWQGPFRGVIGNDERQFNAPGVRVPMLSLSRVYHPSTGRWPYPEYHSSRDTPEAISLDRLEESVDTVMHMLRRLEDNRYPVNLFRGEVFCSRYGLFVDFYQDPEGNRQLFDSMQLIDGTRTVRQIAQEAKAPFDRVLDLLRRLEGHGLVRFSDLPAPRSFKCGGS